MQPGVSDQWFCEDTHVLSAVCGYLLACATLGLDSRTGDYRETISGFTDRTFILPMSYFIFATPNSLIPFPVL